MNDRVPLELPGAPGKYVSVSGRVTTSPDEADTYCPALDDEAPTVRCPARTES